MLPGYQPPGGGETAAPRKRRFPLVPFVILVLLIVAGIGFWKWFKRPAEDIVSALSSEQAGEKPAADSNGVYQAVFLDNGQVYFGKLENRDWDGENDLIRLTEVFYLEFRANPQTGDPSASSDVSLLKLGNEMHGPEDAMDINRDHVLFIEDLKGDSKVVQAISAYKSKKTQ